MGLLRAAVCALLAMAAHLDAPAERSGQTAWRLSYSQRKYRTATNAKTSV